MKKGILLCVIVDVVLKTGNWDVYAWKQKKSFMYEAKESVWLEKI